MNGIHLSEVVEMNRIHELHKSGKFRHSGQTGTRHLDSIPQSPILKGMKRLLSYVAICTILLSLSSCGNIGRLFGGMTGQPVPVYR